MRPHRRCDRRTRPPNTAAVLKAALADLVDRGVVTTGIDEQGKITYAFKDQETAMRLLRESEETE